MLITCPWCGYKNIVDDDKIVDKEKIAITCRWCGYEFTRIPGSLEKWSDL